MIGGAFLMKMVRPKGKIILSQKKDIVNIKDGTCQIMLERTGGRIQELLEFKRVPEERKVTLVATRFRGKAASWWLQQKASRSREGKSSINSWAEIEKVMRKAFLPYNFDHTMFTQLQNLRQGSRSVDDYAEEFTLLLTRNEILDSETQLVSRFIGGLRSQIQNAMSQFDPIRIAEAHQRAVAFET
uniref:Retrotransposon gag domain-containing protein n=1 Tax=Brassica oleracea var. oleracea TaxID=109376 RepID=A0A0D3DIN6_BRAOL